MQIKGVASKCAEHDPMVRQDMLQAQHSSSVPYSTNLMDLSRFRLFSRNMSETEEGSHVGGNFHWSLWGTRGAAMQLLVQVLPAGVFFFPNSHSIDMFLTLTSCGYDLIQAAAKVRNRDRHP